MKKRFLSLTLIFCFSFAYAQTNLDSLYSVWEDKTNSDSLRINAFQYYIWDGYVYSKPDSALILTDKLLQFSNEKEFKFGISIGYNLMGVSNWIKGDYRKALEYYEKCYELRSEVNDIRGSAVALNNIGNVYLIQDIHQSALYYYKKSVKIFEVADNKKGMYLPLNNIGLIYQNLEDYPKALE